MDKAAFSLEEYKFEQASFNLQNIENNTTLDLSFEPSGVYIKRRYIQS